MASPLRNLLISPRGWIARLSALAVAPRKHPGAPAEAVLFVSGEPDTPGHSYRVTRYSAAAAAAGFDVGTIRCDELERSPVSGFPDGRPKPALWHPHLVIIWRATWSPALKTAIRRWKSAGARVVFDVDDYMFDPALATVEVIDGIRSQSVEEAAVAEMYARVNRAFLLCDAGLAPTEPLAHAMRRWGKPAFVLPNGFDDAAYETSRVAVADRRRTASDGLIRIGYAAGSRTHQRDFAVAAPALARVLRERPQCRLVLFRVGTDGIQLVDIGEYSEFSGLEDRIEWRPLRPLAELPFEIARFDVNLAPLEVGNLFCEAKSELKFFEAALCEVSTIASPTVPFASAMVHGRNGLLATTPDDWYEALLSLIDDSDRRQAMGRMAMLSVLWKYGPDGRRQGVSSVYPRLLAGPAASAREFAYGRLVEARSRRLPMLPDTEQLFLHDTGQMPAVAVVIPCYNYARYVSEALESVAAQTERSLEVIVVDDRSTDDAVNVVSHWLQRHADRFVRVMHLRNRSNSRLSLTRNAGFAAAEASLIFPLDADNVLTPDCLRRLRLRITATGAAAAHPSLVRFGDTSERKPALPWNPELLKNGNYIDAMALIRKSAWSLVGGYESMPLGWEDYDFWCLFVEAGLWSVEVPDATARYRVHGTSMLHSITDLPENRRKLIEFLHGRHPWLDIPQPA
jgi:GT2 family glycosyltransferase/glycosyltransferase involved in cell wall biosynthesis